MSAAAEAVAAATAITTADQVGVALLQALRLEPFWCSGELCGAIRRPTRLLHRPIRRDTSRRHHIEDAPAAWCRHH